MLEGLRESEEKFRTLFNNAADMITVHSILQDGLPGTFTEVNDIACRRLGYTREELLRMRPEDIVDPAMMGFIRANSEKLRADGHTLFEITLITKDKRRIPVEIRTHLFEYQGQTLVIAQIRDITQKKAAEAAIREREARLQSIIRAAPAGIGMVVNREIREVNDQLCTMTGYTPLSSSESQPGYSTPRMRCSNRSGSRNTGRSHRRAEDRLRHAGREKTGRLSISCSAPHPWTLMISRPGSSSLPLISLNRPGQRPPFARARNGTENWLRSLLMQFSFTRTKRSSTEILQHRNFSVPRIPD